MTALDMRSSPGGTSVAGTVTISVRSIERTALAIVHEKLGVEISVIRVRLSDDHGGLALAITTPVVIEPVQAGGAEGASLLDRLHRDRAHIASRMEELTGRKVSRVDLRVTGTHDRVTRRVV
ncbi:hypothetical protein [Rathayibacter toxicus]|uniref:hypothetical protein n=1 Tax=Rathayibacter toxicus TaxID=145458 RepID=UPI001C052906|nr:hypothetical protein [Rathayibacter toxicus]QWL30932.1 hypothetical protein E2R34_09380 [Rathayibacter toxicus]